MFAMFNQIFATIGMFFSALFKLAGAADHMAGSVKESAASYEDETRLLRQHRVAELLKEYGITELPKAPPKVIAATKVKSVTPAITA